MRLFGRLIKSHEPDPSELLSTPGEGEQAIPPPYPADPAKVIPKDPSFTVPGVQPSSLEPRGPQKPPSETDDHPLDFKDYGEFVELVSIFHENSPTGIYRMSRGGEILASNKALPKILGFSGIHDLLGKSFVELGLIDAETSRRFFSIMDSEGSVRGYESTWTKPDGSVMYARENASLVERDGQAFYEGTIEDITEHQEAEEWLLRRTEELSVLHSIAIAASDAQSIDELIESTTQIIGNALYPDHFGVLLLSPDNKSLSPHPSYRGISEIEKKVNIDLDHGVTGRAAKFGKLINLSDVRSEMDYVASEGPKMLSELSVPLYAGDTLFGVINVESAQKGAFTNADEHLMEILTRQVGAAVERIRARASEMQHNKHISTIYEISQEIVGASLEPEQVYSAIHQAVAKLMPCEALVISLASDDPQLLDTVYAIDRTGRIPAQKIPVESSFTGWVIEARKSMMFNDLDHEDLSNRFIHFGDEEHVSSVLAVPMILGGKVMGCLSAQSYLVNAYSQEDLQMLELLAAHAAIALGNAQLFNETRQRAEEMSVLVKVSSALRIAPTRLEMVPIILEQVCELLRITSSALILIDHSTDEFVVELATNGWKKLKGIRAPIQTGLMGQLLSSRSSLVNIDIRTDPLFSGKKVEHPVAVFVPLLAQERTIGALCAGCDSPFSENEIRLITTVADIAANAIHRSTLHEQTRNHAEQMAIVTATGRALAETFDQGEIFDRLGDALYKLIPFAERVGISLFGGYPGITTVAYEKRNGLLGSPVQIPHNQLPAYVTKNLEHARRTRQLVTSKEPCSPDQAHLPEPQPESLYIPMITKGGVLGVIRICANYPARFSPSDQEVLLLVANTAAISIENARLFKETEQRMNRLAALRSMDMAISSSFDLRVTLNVMLDQITAQLGVDASDVLLYNEFTQSLEYSTGRGFRSQQISRTRLRLDEDLPGKAALERRTISLSDYPQFTLRSPRLVGEDFVAYYGVPLLAKGQLKGVLEIFHRSPLHPDTEWIDFLETLAGDTAIAIDSTTLFNDLQRSNIELTLAYDTTLEGWSRIMELRKLEPEGHTQRILDKTIQLAMEMGIGEEELVHIRRGVLLHDIGIFGVPESIVQKSGPLTTEEWAVIRQHPVYAYDLLLPIPYLRPALEIPYCHHEKWDGTGYPRGLKGNQIPLAARIFALVDVWDALRTQRTYRPAWPNEKVIEYLRSQAGLHFDPHITQVFLRLLSEV